MTNRRLLNALPHITEQGCKWRGLPEHFGNWHAIYAQMNRWSKSGVMERIFIRLWPGAWPASLQRRGTLQRRQHREQGFNFCGRTVPSSHAFADRQG